MKEQVLISLLLILSQTTLCANAQFLEPRYDSSGDAVEAREESRAVFLLQGKVRKRAKAKQKAAEARYDSSREGSLDSSQTTLTGESELTEQLEQEMAIEWDSWHKRFQRDVFHKFSAQLWGDDAVSLGGLILKLGTLPVRHFPEGTKASFECEILNSREIRNLHLTSSSGNAEFDKLVLRSVESLNGKRSLKFPKSSRRTLTAESISLWIDKKNAGFHFKPTGDVERVKEAAMIHP